MSVADSMYEVESVVDELRVRRDECISYKQ